MLDENRQPLEQATVEVDLPGKEIGQLTDMQGRFVLQLPRGTYTLVVHYMGYQTLRKTVELHSPLVVEFQLTEDPLELETTTVTGDGRDPAYGIIEKVRDNRKALQARLGNHSYATYSKTRIDASTDTKNIPLLGKEGRKELDSLLSLSQILYLSEAESRVYRKPPEKMKEVVYASKVSGSRESYSMFSTLYLDFDLNDNIIEMGELSERGGFVSPIGAGCMLHYRYKLLGISKINGDEIYKIAVMPRRKNDPVFEGIVWVVKDEWSIHGYDLRTDRAHQLAVLDSMRVRQENIGVEGNRLASHIFFDFEGGLMGINFQGYLSAVYSQYQMNDTLLNKQNYQEIIRIEDDAARPDTAYWQARRPLPLDSLEERDYQVKDSIEKVTTSDAYLDSLTKAQKPPGLTSILTGYSYSNYRTGSTFRISSPLPNLNFNTIEGWMSIVEASYGWKLNKYKRLTLDGRARYGVASARWYGEGGLEYKLSSRRIEGKDREAMTLSLKGGSWASEFGPYQQITPLANSLYTLLDRRNYLRMYEKQYGLARLDFRPLTWTKISAQMGIEQRLALYNHSNPAEDWTALTPEDRPFLPNLPLAAHTVATMRLALQLLPGSQYISTPDGRLYTGSNKPSPTLAYDMGHYLNGPSEGVTFHRLQLNLEYTLGMKTKGRLETYSAIGSILDSSGLLLPDYQHFIGNQTWVLGNVPLRQFKTQDYYSYATPRWWLEAHAEYHALGLLWNKLPLLRKLKWHELASIHLLATDRGQYLEWSLGLENIGIKMIRPLRVEASQRLLGDSTSVWNFTLGVVLKLN